MQNVFLLIATVGLCSALWRVFDADKQPSPAERWLHIGDVDQNGRLDAQEYARISDGKTPMQVLDVNRDDALEIDEIEGFFLGVDPIDLMGQ